MQFIKHQSLFTKFPMEIRDQVLAHVDVVGASHAMSVGVVDHQSYRKKFDNEFEIVLDKLYSVGHGASVFDVMKVEMFPTVYSIILSWIDNTDNWGVPDVSEKDEGYCYLGCIRGDWDRLAKNKVAYMLGPNPRAPKAAVIISFFQVDQIGSLTRVNDTGLFHFNNEGTLKIRNYKFARHERIGGEVSQGFSLSEENSILKNFLQNLNKGDSLAEARNNINGLSRWTVSRQGASAVKSFIDSKLIDISKHYKSKQKKKLTRGQRDLLNYVQGANLSIDEMESLTPPPVKSIAGSIIETVSSSFISVNKGKSKVYTNYDHSTSKLTITSNHTIDDVADIIRIGEKASAHLDVLNKEYKLIEKNIALAAMCEEKFDNIFKEGKLTDNMKDVSEYIDFLEKSRRVVIDDEIMSLNNFSKELNISSIRNESLESLVTEYKCEYPKDMIIREKISDLIDSLEFNHDEMINKLIEGKDKYKPSIPEKPDHLKVTKNINQEEFNFLNNDTSCSELNENDDDNHESINEHSNFHPVLKGTSSILEGQFVDTISDIVASKVEKDEVMEKEDAIKYMREPNITELIPKNIKVKNEWIEYRRDSGVVIDEIDNVINSRSKELMNKESVEHDFITWEDCDRTIRSFYNIPLKHDFNVKFGSRTSWEYFIFTHKAISKLYGKAFKYKYRTDLKKLDSLKRVATKYISAHLYGKKLDILAIDDNLNIKNFFRESFNHIYGIKVNRLTLKEPNRLFDEILDSEMMELQYNMMIENRIKNEEYNSTIKTTNSKIQSEITIRESKLNKILLNIENSSIIKIPYLNIEKRRIESEIIDLKKSFLSIKEILDLNPADMMKMYKRVDTEDYSKYKEVRCMSLKNRYLNGFANAIIAPGPAEFERIVKSNLSTGDYNSRMMCFTFNEQGFLDVSNTGDIYLGMNFRGFSRFSEISDALMRYSSVQLTNSCHSRMTDHQKNDPYFMYCCIQSLSCRGYISSKIFFTRKSHRRELEKALLQVLGDFRLRDVVFL